MKAGAPLCRPMAGTRCGHGLANFAKGRVLLPFFFAFTPAAAGQGMTVPASASGPPAAAGVMPSAAELVPRPGGGLRLAGAQRARALARSLQAERVLQEQGAAAALPIFRELMTLDPSDAALATRVAGMAAAAGRPDEALSMLEEAVKKNSYAEGPVVALTKFMHDRRGEGLQAEAEAEQQLQRALTKFPGNASLCALAVRTKVMDQRRAEAQAIVRLALSRGGKSPDFYLLMAPAAREAFPLDDPDTRAEHLAVVAGCLEKALALAPADAGVLQQAAEQYSLMDQPGKAAEIFRRVITADQSNLSARLRLGQTLRQSGDAEGAMQAFEDLLRIDPSATAAHRALASMLEAAARPRDALKHHVELLRIDGGAVEDYLKMARKLEEADLSSEARLTLERGCFSWPRSPRLAIAHATALHTAGRVEEASAEFERGVDLASKHDPAALDYAYYLARARCARDAGQRETAAIHFRKAINLATAGKVKNAGPAYAGLAMLWLEDGSQLPEAKELLRVAASMNKDEPSVIEAGALHAACEGDWAAALKAYRRVEKSMQSAASLLRMAEALQQNGLKAEALPFLDKAAATNPPAAGDRQKLEALRLEKK